MLGSRLIPQTAAWYDRLATLQDGYQYPWRSQVGRWHGEDAYLALESWWSFDVPEVFGDPESLYAWLTWGSGADEMPPFGDVRPVLERICLEHAAEHPVDGSFVTGVAIRRRRYLWRAMVPR